MRIFIAIDFKDEYFKELQDKIKNEIKGTFPKSFHLTLKFLGEVEENKIDKIRELLRNIKFESFKISLSNIGVFPNENYMRVIWIGLEPKEKIIELQKNIDNELSKITKVVFEHAQKSSKKISDMLKLKFPKEKRFEPHLTLARVKFIKDKNKLKELLKNIKIDKLEFNVDNFKLIKSILTKNGPIYEDIETFKSS